MQETGHRLGNERCVAVGVAVVVAVAVSATRIKVEQVTLDHL